MASEGALKAAREIRAKHIDQYPDSGLQSLSPWARLMDVAEIIDRCMAAPSPGVPSEPAKCPTCLSDDPKLRKYFYYAASSDDHIKCDNESFHSSSVSGREKGERHGKVQEMGT